MKLMHPNSDQTIEVRDDQADRYRGQGWREIAADAPKGSAPLAEWQEYARSKGFSDDDIEGKSRSDLRAALA